MSLIDTHTHLESFARRGLLPEVLARAQAANVDQMVAIGTSPEDWDLYRELARSHRGVVHYSVGLHPCSVDEGWEKSVDQMADFWTAPQNAAVGGLRPVALGEIGLDRFHLPQNDPAAAEQIFEWQRRAFAQGLALAKRLDCPVVIHSRGAFAECVAMIDESGVNWSNVVFHCFTEGEAEMAELIRRGGWGSFTGIITYKTAQSVRAAAQAQGLARLMIETDAPYLTPVPHRGKSNEPAFLRHTAEFCARELFHVSDEQFSQITTANARRFFAI